MLSLWTCQYEEQTSCLIFNTGLSDIMKGNVCVYYLLLCNYRFMAFYSLQGKYYSYCMYKGTIYTCTHNYSKVLVSYIAAILC